jgi:hypothetical protein
MLFAYAIEQPTGKPEMIGNSWCPYRSDLELPLRGHNLCVNASKH